MMFIIRVAEGPNTSTSFIIAVTLTVTLSLVWYCEDKLGMRLAIIRFLSYVSACIYTVAINGHNFYNSLPKALLNIEFPLAVGMYSLYSVGIYLTLCELVDARKFWKLSRIILKIMVFITFLTAYFLSYVLYLRH